MYSLSDYAEMLTDPSRMTAYVRALRQEVRPASVVVDLGAGTGIFALAACQCGARRVYAIEPSEVVQLAREAAQANGYADRLVVLPGLSTRTRLPERASLIVSELRGVLPLYGRHLPAIVDARERFLAPGGTLIPAADTLWAAPVEAPELFQQHVGVWQARPEGLDWTSAAVRASHRFYRGHIAAGQLLAEPCTWGRLDYRILTSPHVAGRIVGSFSRDGTSHGLALWFDAHLTESIGFSTAPAAAPTVYGQAFLPWPQPVPVQAGHRFEVSLRAQLLDDDYVWCWDSSVHSAPGNEVRFRQSTFQGELHVPEHLARMASSHVPRLNDEGQAVLFALQHMQGTQSHEQLARRLCERFPARFPSPREALTFLGTLALAYSAD